MRPIDVVRMDERGELANRIEDARAGLLMRRVNDGDVVRRVRLQKFLRLVKMNGAIDRQFRVDDIHRIGAGDVRRTARVRAVVEHEELLASRHERIDADIHRERARAAEEHGFIRVARCMDDAQEPVRYLAHDRAELRFPRADVRHDLCKLHTVRRRRGAGIEEDIPFDWFHVHPFFSFLSSARKSSTVSISMTSSAAQGRTRISYSPRCASSAISSQYRACPPGAS